MKLFVLFLLIASSIFSESESIISLNKIDEPFLAGKYIYYLEDKEGKFTIEDILREENQKNFRLFTRDVFSLPATESKYWFKILIKNETLEDIWIEVGSSYAWFIDFYSPAANKEYSIPFQTGTMRPKENKFYDVELFWLPANKAGDNQVKAYYLNIWEESPFEVPIHIGTIRSLYKKKSLNDYFTAAFLGIMSIMLLYNSFLYLSTRDSAYVFYLGYILLSVFIVPFSNNYPIIEHIGFGIIPREWWHSNFLVWFSLINIFIAGFTVRYFNLKETMPRGRVFIYASLGIISGIYPVLVLLKFPAAFINNSVQVFLLLFYISCLTAATYMLVHDYKKALYYFLGWTSSLVGTTVFLLLINGYIPFNVWTRNSTYIGFVCEVWLFSLALGDRINTMRREKEEALALLVSKSLENEKLVKEQNELLEKQVSIRTIELKDALNEIKQDLIFAKKIQSKILPLNLKNLDTLDISSEYRPMEEVGGDYFDIFQTENKLVRIFIADATGHGVQAALITMLIKSEYEGIKEAFDSPGLVLETLNNVFINKYNSLSSFFSCFIVDIDLSNKKFIYSSAGHPKQLFIQEEQIEGLERTGKLIGIVKKSEFKDVVKSFQTGDKLLLFTDGLYEEFNQTEQEFGEEEISRLVKLHKSSKMEFIIEKLLHGLNDFLSGASIQDDITVVGVELN